MKSHEAMKAAIQKRGPKEVASALGVSVSLLYKWMEPPDEGARSGAQNPLDRLVRICRLCADATPVHWLCRQMDGSFVANRRADPAVRIDVLAETQRMLREFSDVLNAVGQGYADGRLTPEESARIRAEWEELKQIGEAFVAACEASSSSRDSHRRG